MKTNEKKVQVITNANEIIKFGIALNAKSFDILSGGIYTYKIAAIIREICSNAYDSHVVANKADVPFEVTLPTEIHPYFEVEDFGIGMDYNTIKEVFVNMFVSTKQESNDEIGTHGLGSKSPITYTDAYNIRTRKNGIERNYTCYRGEDRTPLLNMLSEEPTSECDGVKISVPVVNREDFEVFRRDAEFILSFFQTRPIVYPSLDFKYTEDQINFLLTNGYMISEDRVSSTLYSTSKFYVVMGAVCYPVAMGDFRDESWYSVYYNSMHGTSVFINVPIGFLTAGEIPVSRESLSYETETFTKLSQKFESSLKTYRNNIEEEINQFSSDSKAIIHIANKYKDRSRKILSWFTSKDNKSTLLYKSSEIGLMTKHKIAFFIQHYRGNNRVNSLSLRDIIFVDNISVVVTSKDKMIGIENYCRNLSYKT